LQPGGHLHLRAEDASQHGAHPGHRLADVDHLGVTISRRLKARSCRVSSAARWAAVRICSMSSRTSGRSTSASTNPAVALDDHQQVVEVVRHAAGELPEEGEPFLVRAAALALALLGDVAHDDHQLAGLARGAAVSE
jgi:hypothetical protein